MYNAPSKISNLARFVVKSVKTLLPSSSVEICTLCAHVVYKRLFGSFMKRSKIEQNSTKVSFYFLSIFHQISTPSVIKTMKLLLRILIIKKTCPKQWAKIRQLDGECNNRSVRLDVKGFDRNCFTLTKFDCRMD